MALKGDRYIISTRPDMFMDEVAERGGFASFSTMGSGAALDQARQLATYAATPSGKVPLGVVLEDMVNVDLTQYKLNQHKLQVQQGGKISIADKGWVRTNYSEGTVPNTAGVPAYLGHSGRVTQTLDANGGLAASPLVGRFESTADEDGYFRVNFNLP